jgi:hypothetical protein
VGDPGSLAVPDTQERFLALLERATTLLIARLEAVVRENERLTIEGELRSREVAHVTAERDAVLAELEAMKTAHCPVASNRTAVAPDPDPEANQAQETTQEPFRSGAPAPTDSWWRRWLAAVYGW